MSLPPVADSPVEDTPGAPSTSPPAEDLDAFCSLSAALSGFDDVELRATGVGETYLAWLLRVFGDVMAELLGVWRTIEADDPPDRREAALREKVLADPTLGPLARAVLVLWYTATWRPLSADWSAAHGKHPGGDEGFVFGTAYPEGLMWRAAVGAHPAAAKPTGFGSWALAPEDT